MKIKTLALVALLAVPAIATAEDSNQTAPQKDQSKDTSASKLSDADIADLAHVQHINHTEINLGKLAETRGTAPVKRYAEQLVRDHQASNKEVMAFAKKRGVSKIPADKPVTAAEQQEMKEMKDQEAKLKTMKGADFDRMYLQMMVDGHEKELARNDTMIAQTTDPELKTLLEARKPMLQRHAEAAKELLKSNPPATSSTKPETK